MTDRSRRPDIRLLAVLTLCLALLIAACGTPDPALDGNATVGAKPEGRILFAQGGDIFVWDGSIEKVLEVGNASYPRWSRDGDRFVMVRTGDAYSDLWIANADGSGLQQLTFNKPQLQPGTKAYVDQALWALDPVWSPASDQIAFVMDRGTSQNYLWLMSEPGADPIRVAASTVNGDHVERPSFSPDGQQIVFAQRATGDTSLQRTTRLWKVTPATGALEPVAEAEGGAYAPAWSPDGNWIAYIVRTGTENDVWVVPAEGGEPTRLTDLGDVAAPAWSPDGTWLAFLKVDGTSFKAMAVEFSVGPDGVPTAGKPQELFKADHIDAVSGLSWAP